MKKILFAVVAMLLASASPARAETIQEAVERQEKQAVIDRKLIPVYAVTVERLRGAVPIPGMPDTVIKAARRAMNGGETNTPVGKSEVQVRNEGGIVTFTISPHASSAPDMAGAVYFTSLHDPVEELTAWVRGLHTIGIVFAKSDKTENTAVPSFGSCYLGAIQTKDMNLYVACQRFQLGLSDDFHMLKTNQDVLSEREFLVYLLANYGSKGILTREEVANALGNQMSQVRALVKASKERTGYITYVPSTASLELKSGRQLSANLYNGYETVVNAGGHVKLELNVYARSISTVRIELRYEDGTGIAPTAMGNAAEATVHGKEFVKSDVYDFAFVELPLPLDLKPGKIIVVASAVDEKGGLIVDKETVGEFQYPPKKE